MRFAIGFACGMVTTILAMSTGVLGLMGGCALAAREKAKQNEESSTK